MGARYVATRRFCAAPSLRVKRIVGAARPRTSFPSGSRCCCSLPIFSRPQILTSLFMLVLLPVGPGKYLVHATDFAPVTVASGEDREGLTGHTWSQHYAATGARLDPAAEHAAAMASATARLRAVSPGARSVSAASLAASQAGGADGSASVTTEALDGGGTAEHAATTLLAAAGGNAKAALEASIRRERNLRKEVAAMNKQVNAQRLAIANSTSQMRQEQEATNAKLAKKTMALDAAQSKLHAWRDVFLKVDETLTVAARAAQDLAASLATAEAAAAGSRAGPSGMERAVGKYPALGRLLEAQRDMEHALEAAASQLMASNAGAATAGNPNANGNATGATSNNGDPNAATFTSYSSLAAALATPQAMGDLGPSGKMIRSVTSAAAMNASAASPGNSRARSPTGAGGRPASPSGGGRDIGIQPAAQRQVVDLAARGISSKDIANFARRAAGNTAAAPPDAPNFLQPAPAPRATSPSPSVAASTATSGGRRPTALPQAPVLRRFQGAPVELPHELAESPVQASESTVAEKLAQIFAYYALYGADRDADGSTLRSQQFFKLVRDAGVLDARVALADVDVAFTRAVGRGGAAHAGLGARMSYDDFVAALADIACRKYGIAGNTTAGGLLVDGDALRRLLQEHVLPLYLRLRHDPLFVADVLHAGAAAGATAAFADEFLKPEVLAFFNEHRGALQAIFAQYADLGVAGDGGPASAATAAAGARMSKRGLLAFAHDYKVVPEMISRPDLLALLKETTKSGAAETSEELTFLAWIELLGLLAHTLAELSESAGRAGKGITGMGVADAAKPSMLARVHLLFFNMYQHGAQFGGGDGGKMIRAVVNAVRADVEAAQRESERAARASTAVQLKKVQDVLLDNVRM